MEFPNAPNDILEALREERTQKECPKCPHWSKPSDKYFEAMLERLGHAAKGERNIVLNQVAWGIGTWVDGAELDEELYRLKLLQAATTNGLIDDPDDGAETVARTIESGWNAGRKNPHTVQPPTISRSGAAPSSTGEIRTGDDPPISVTWAEKITAKPIQWMWKGRIARGKLTLIGGDPGLGKGLLGIDTAMRVSTGTAWPDGEPCPGGRVLLLTGEDDPEDTVKPRLEAAGADVSRVGLVGIMLDGKRVNLVDHAQLLVQTAVQVGASVLVIDPLSSYLGAGSGKINAWRAQDIRAVLDPLVESLRGTQLALIVVVHLNKTEGQQAMYRLSDSIAILAAARIGFLVAPHPDDPDVRVLAALKSNISKKPISLSFEIEEVFVASVNDSIGRVHWLHEVEITADDLVGVKKQESPRATVRAQEFLSDLLADGGVASTEVEAKAKTQGIGRGSLWEAKKQMNVVARKVAHDGWVWELPIRITLKKPDQVEA